METGISKALELEGHIGRKEWIPVVGRLINNRIIRPLFHHLVCRLLDGQFLPFLLKLSFNFIVCGWTYKRGIIIQFVISRFQRFPIILRLFHHSSSIGLGPVRDDHQSEWIMIRQSPIDGTVVVTVRGFTLMTIFYRSNMSFHLHLWLYGIYPK